MVSVLAPVVGPLMATDTKQEPTIEYCRELLEHVQKVWSNSTQGDLDTERITMYWDEDRVPQENTAARGRRRKIQPERVTANELRREVDLITSLFPYPAEIGVQYIGEGSREESTAEKVEVALNEAIDQLNPPLDSPLTRERWQMCLLGRAARLIVPGHMYWWDFPYMQEGETLDAWSKRHNLWQGQAPIPVCWVDLPAESTFPASFGRIDEELISWQEVTGYDLVTMFSPEELSGVVEFTSQSLSDEYTLIIFSNQVWLAYGITPGPTGNPSWEGKLIRPIEHGLGVPAIQITPGQTSGKKEPGRYWQGVADSSIALIKAGNRRMSEAATASKFDSLPIFKHWMQENSMLGEGASADDEIAFNGDIIDLRGGSEGLEKEDIEPLFMPRFGDKTLALGQWLYNRAERNSGAVEALEGAAGPSGEPAWSRNSVIEQSKMKQSRLSSGVAGADVAAADMISRCIQSFGEDVYLTPKGRGPKIILKPSQLKDYRIVLKAEYKMKLPVSFRADFQLGISAMEQAQRAGLPISPALVMERIMDIQRPMEEFKRSVTWRLLMSPKSQAYYENLLVKESEQDLSEDEGAGVDELQQLLASGQITPEIASQFAQLATGQGNGANPLGNRGERRAGIPFSASPTGPQPEQEIQGNY